MEKTIQKMEKAGYKTRQADQMELAGSTSQKSCFGQEYRYRRILLY